jgi:hypothetical protein
MADAVSLSAPAADPDAKEAAALLDALALAFRDHTPGTRIHAVQVGLRCTDYVRLRLRRRCNRAVALREIADRLVAAERERVNVNTYIKFAAVSELLADIPGSDQLPLCVLRQFFQLLRVNRREEWVFRPDIAEQCNDLGRRAVKHHLLKAAVAEDVRRIMGRPPKQARRPPSPPSAARTAASWVSSGRSTSRFRTRRRSPSSTRSSTPARRPLRRRARCRTAGGCGCWRS